MIFASGDSDCLVPKPDLRPLWLLPAALLLLLPHGALVTAGRLLGNARDVAITDPLASDGDSSDGALDESGDGDGWWDDDGGLSGGDIDFQGQVTIAFLS